MDRARVVLIAATVGGVAGGIGAALVLRRRRAEAEVSAPRLEVGLRRLAEHRELRH